MSQSPKPEDYFTKIPLYESFDMPEDTLKSWVDRLNSIVYYSRKIDIFCPSCKKESTFINSTETSPITGVLSKAHMSGTSEPYDYCYKLLKKTRYFQVKFTCSRDSEHSLIYVFSLIDNKFTKIGQFPSIADLSAADIKKYAKALSKEKHMEFSKSIGLAAHGVGIGSFVYLRRIFEGLIEEAHTEAKTSPLWDENAYQRNRAVDKIVLLKDYLPDFLVQKKNMYGILSKGIHELSENECLKYYPIMKFGIELILDEKLEKIERQKKIIEVKKSIDQIHQSLVSGK